jgi:hypothetical protein
MATIILARRSNKICPYHLQTTLAARDENAAVRKARIKLLEKHHVANTNS